ncbi:MAG: PspC domain-containing protein [Alphaproteobacteria bacterium]|nr:PspC domain-containing protein [Alphaproteobacteria bacterium]MBV9371196.1 PspC domain-containing protein [Alphaproteobacteria bacterium]MBV9899926.1 PspC domain-containing protein [Alphaproteobacteria bacterium]
MSSPQPQPLPQPSLLTRHDTLLGVCEALGEDFRFNANWLRIAFAVSLLWNPAAVIGLYLALGLLVAASRWLAPNPRPAAAAAEPLPAPAVAAEAQDEAEPFAVAA